MEKRGLWDFACFERRMEACADSEKPQIHAAQASTKHAEEGKVEICMLVLGEVSMRKGSLWSSTCFERRMEACADSEKPQIYAAQASTKHAREGKEELRMLTADLGSVRRRGRWRNACRCRACEHAGERKVEIRMLESRAWSMQGREKRFVKLRMLAAKYSGALREGST